MLNEESEHPHGKLLAAAGMLSLAVMPFWIPFDYLVDPQNFKTFLALRVAYVGVVLAGLTAFIRAGKQVKHYRRFGLFMYVTTILTILPMCIMTDAKFPYYIGFSTVFFAASILIVWPLGYFLTPLFLSWLVLGLTHWNSAIDPVTLITGLFLMVNVCVMSGVASWLTHQGFLNNQVLLNQLEELSNTDRLTGLKNRRFFDLQLDHELAHAARNDTKTTVLMIDVDFFKKYNDHYGHPMGDECLHRIAMCLNQVTTRKTDFVARYGGEEFVIVLPDTDIEGAIGVAKKTLEAIAAAGIAHSQSSVAPFVTVSIGIGCSKSRKAEELVATADLALYQAKQNGRNRYAVG